MKTPLKRRLGQWALWLTALALILGPTTWAYEFPFKPVPTKSKRESANRERIKVVKVVDGDTVWLSDGRPLRYIGMDSPEMRRRTPAGWVSDPQPLAREATERNRQWVLGRRDVVVEWDARRQDRYGRWLGYVFLSDGTMVNERLVQRGLARALPVEPNTRYRDRFFRAEKKAQDQRLGIWEIESS